MPLYVYRAKKDGCDTCRAPFEVLQAVSAAPLVECPDCDAPVEKQITAPVAHFPDGPASLRNKGFARLEKRSDGSYENVSAQPGAQKVGSLESFGESLKKGPNPILTDD